MVGPAVKREAVAHLRAVMGLSERRACSIVDVDRKTVRYSPRRPADAELRALRALGRIERTLFTLQWLSDPDLRQRSHAGLNKGEASNSLRRAIFFHRQGEVRDRTFENQSFRASGLSLVTAAIVHWNTVYLDRAVQHLRAQGVTIPDDLLAHVAPLGWEHIVLTGDYVLDRQRRHLRLPIAPRCSCCIPVPSRLAYDFEQIVR